MRILILGCTHTRGPSRPWLLFKLNSTRYEKQHQALSLPLTATTSRSSRPHVFCSLSSAAWLFTHSKPRLRQPLTLNVITVSNMRSSSRDGGEWLLCLSSSPMHHQPPPSPLYFAPQSSPYQPTGLSPFPLFIKDGKSTRYGEDWTLTDVYWDCECGFRFVSQWWTCSFPLVTGRSITLVVALHG